MDESVQKHLEQAAITKLSSAIRLGALMRPKCEREWFTPDGRSCALGAAWDAIYGRKAYTGHKRPGPLLMEHFGMQEIMLTRITNMNDSGWSREQIADWLEGQGL